MAPDRDGPFRWRGLTAGQISNSQALTLTTGKAQWENRYTNKFRMIRDAASVPANVWSMDTRAGAVTETVHETGSLDSGRDLATHSTVQMTAKYNRGDRHEKSRVIALARVERRNKQA